ncbi:putative pentatricopeptide repeat-containing protein At1g69350, mitochondrial [Mangifera indica]|uniref:putative pentatricopeptide repeat-containing protein At1g69350, mitochondrial n=1 Tax=Mangifera indica TaxID=29780 RepID=UPI001CFA121D|nr:putative pentatricopeptide repeat-containing protein At1g69350, mitochondrial [Mangifera indica]
MSKKASNPPVQWPQVSPYSFLPRFSANLLPLFFSSNHSKPSTYNSSLNLISLLKHCRSIQHLKPLKSLLIVHGLTKNNPFLGEFFKSCFHLGAPGLALSAFQTIKNPCMFLQNLMVRNLCNYGLYEDLLCLYMKCRVSGCSSDEFTFPFVIKACSSLRALGIGREIHCIVLKTGYDKNLVIQTALVDFYAKNGDMETARVLVDGISQPDSVSWNALIAGYSSNGLHQQAFETYRRALETGLKPNVSTLASVIPVCTRLGLFHFGKSLHGFIVKSGYMGDLFLVPALISMYTGDFDLSMARKLFDSVVEKNVTVWNAIISAYTQSKKFFKAFEMFRGMVRGKLKLDLVTFVSIIPSCEDYSCIDHGESLHACAVKHGLENQLSVSTAFLSMYAKFGNFDLAKYLFDQTPTRNLLSWNVMISGCSSNGLCDASLAVFREMQIEGFNPDAVSLISVISACSKLEVILLGKSAHAFSLRKGLDANIDVTNALLMLYSNCGKLSYSFKLFYRIPIRNSVSWNTLISGCIHSGKVKEAMILLEQMQKEGTELDMVTLISIIPSFSENENLKEGMAIHGYAVKTGYTSDVSLTNALITMYCNCGNLNDGRLLFEVMHERDLVSWNSIISACRYHNLQNEVLVLFREMRREGQRPNHVSLLNLLPACCTEVQGKSAHAFAIRTGFVQETPLLTSLIFMYNRFENTKLSLLIFQMADKRDISLWNAVMSVHIQIKNAKQVIAFFSEMSLMDLEPDKVTVMSLISACVQLNSLNLAHSVMAWLIQKGFDKDVTVSNALIDLYVRCGNLSFAVKLFESLLEKDPVSWGIMINGYGLHGDIAAALDLFVKMQLSGLRPNEIIYSSILSACSHAGLIGQSQLVFNSMVEHGISPKMEHYACMVDLLGRAGYLNEAFNIVKQLPFKPSVSLLESLLGACRIHSNANLGEKISEMLFEINPENSGSYVMLHNIYASAGRWEDANRVRSEMEKKGLKKMRGFSFV